MAGDWDHKKFIILPVFIPLNTIYISVSGLWTTFIFSHDFGSHTDLCNAGLDVQCINMQKSFVQGSVTACFWRQNIGWLQWWLNELMWRKAYQILMKFWISGNLHLRNSLNSWFPECVFPKNLLLASSQKTMSGKMGFLSGSKRLVLYQGPNPKSTDVNGNSTTDSGGLKTWLIESTHHPAAPYRGFISSHIKKQTKNHHHQWPLPPLPSKTTPTKIQKARKNHVINLQKLFFSFNRKPAWRTQHLPISKIAAHQQ